MRGFLLHVEQLENRRLAGAAGADEKNELAAPDLEVDVTQSYARFCVYSLATSSSRIMLSYCSACSMSAIRSSASSMPMLSRRNPSGMPMAARASLVMWACEL